MKFLKITLVIILVFASAVAIVSCGKNDDAPKDMQRASSEFVNYVLFVPKTWTVDKTDGVISAYVADDKSNVSVTTFTPTRSYDSVVDYTEEYLKTLEKTYVGYEYIEKESLIPTAEKLETGITLGGVNATRLVYKLSQGDTVYKIMQVIISAKGYVYTLTYTALADKYDTHVDDVAKIIAEFKFK